MIFDGDFMVYERHIKYIFFDFSLIPHHQHPGLPQSRNLRLCLLPLQVYLASVSISLSLDLVFFSPVFLRNVCVMKYLNIKIIMSRDNKMIKLLPLDVGSHTPWFALYFCLSQALTLSLLLFFARYYFSHIFFSILSLPPSDSSLCLYLYFSLYHHNTGWLWIRKVLMLGDNIRLLSRSVMFHEDKSLPSHSKINWYRCDQW